MGMQHDVLNDPLVTAAFGDGAMECLSLPQVFAALSAGREITFTALQPHQRHPWHAFMVQLAAMALMRSGRDQLVHEEGDWRSLLSSLTDDAPEPWCLVVEDLERPAFMQPPVPEGTADVLKNRIETPDELDMLVTTRNFDVKKQRIVCPRLEHWMLALVCKQTFEGYSGRDNYGIFRMNGGQASRPCVAAAPSPGWSARFRRDVAIWLEQHDALVEAYGYDRDGAGLLWTLPWDGSSSLFPHELHPFFIEVCRRIRLREDASGLHAVAGTSSKPRIEPSDRSGDTGDIWTPLRASSKKDGMASLTVASGGFNYRKLHDLLFGDWIPPPALELRSSDGEAPVIVACALVRGQGKTEGYHERIIAIPAVARRFFSKRSEEGRLASRSKQQLERCATGSSAVLKPALCSLFQGVRADKLDFRDKRVNPWMDRLEARIDDRFFTELFHSAAQSADEARQRWDAVLVELLTATFEEALEQVSMPTVHRYAIRAGAEARFRGALRKNFPEGGPTAPPVEKTHV